MWDAILNLIFNHQANGLLNDKLLALIINKTKDFSLIQKIVGHPNAKEAVFAACIANKESSDSSILLALEKTIKKEEITDAILATRKENKALLLALANHASLPQEKYNALLKAAATIETFKVVIDRDDITLEIINSLIGTKDLAEDKIRVILKQKNGLMDLELFTTLIEQTNSEENLKLIFNHVENLLLQDEQLALILSKTKSGDFIKQILGHKNAEEKVYLACAQNKNASDSSIDKVLENTNKEETIDFILVNSKTTEAIYQAMAKNQFTSKDDLIHVIKNTKSAATISKVLEHNQLKQVNAEEFYIEIVKNRATSKADLAYIAERACDFETFKAILDHESMLVSDSSTDLVLDKLINNQNIMSFFSEVKSKFAIKLLPMIAERAINLKLVLSILKFNSDVLVLDNLKIDKLEGALSYYLNNTDLHKDEMEIKKNLSIKLILPLFKRLEDSRPKGWLDDDVLSKFIVSNLKDIYSINSEKECKEYKEKIESAISIMQSPEVLAINKIIERLKNEKTSSIGGFFYSSGKEKARRIEKAILAVPMEERRNILTGTSPAIIKVQEALAEHRNYFSKLIHGKAKYLTDGKVDTKGAASSYMDYEKIIKKIKIDEEKPSKGRR